MSNLPKLPADLIKYCRWSIRNAPFIPPLMGVLMPGGQFYTRDRRGKAEPFISNAPEVYIGTPDSLPHGARRVYHVALKTGAWNCRYGFSKPERGDFHLVGLVSDILGETEEFAFNWLVDLLK